jgi:hypothetical protein
MNFGRKDVYSSQKTYKNSQCFTTSRVHLHMEEHLVKEARNSSGQLAETCHISPEPKKGSNTTKVIDPVFNRLENQTQPFAMPTRAAATTITLRSQQYRGEDTRRYEGP